MEPVLNELSLVPSATVAPADRLLDLAKSMRYLDSLGARRALRSTRDASARDIGGGQGMSRWCFDRATDRDAGLLVALRLSAQPFIDGKEGLFAIAEGQRSIEPRLGETIALGAGLAALSNGVLLALGERVRSPADVAVELRILDDTGESRERVAVPTFVLQLELEERKADVLARIDRSIRDGADLLARLSEVFPRLVLGPGARTQIQKLRGTEPFFLQALRHLRALDVGAAQWTAGAAFNPAAVTFSVESPATLDHGRYGPLRDFPCPVGFESRRWTLHTKLTGGPAVRIYFDPQRTANGPVVLIGYLGKHLPTVKGG